MSEPPDVGDLAELLRAAVARSTAGEPCAILYSGGLDSSVLAHLAREVRPRLVVVGRTGAHDLAAARSGAEALGLPLAVCALESGAVLEAAKRWAAELEGADATGRAVAVGLAIGLEATPTPRVLCGQGADELFLGYAHFRGLSPAAAAAQRWADLDRLETADWPRARRIAERLGRTLIAPYLDPSFRTAALATPMARHLPLGGTSKPLLRDVARALGLPEELVVRPKKALQVGSGIARELRGPPRRATPTDRATAR